MRVWAVCVVAFFGAVELYQWVQGLTLPLPIYGVAGLLLALASNADRIRWRPFCSSALATQQPGSFGVPIESHQIEELAIEQPVLSRRPGPQLPNFQPAASASSISFTIPSVRSSASDQPQ